jgi:hypothetical protein
MSGVCSSPSGYRLEGRHEWGHGFVSDPGRLTSPATTVYRLKQKYDAVTVSSQTEGEPLGSLDVASGVTTIQTTWSRKKLPPVRLGLRRLGSVRLGLGGPRRGGGRADRGRVRGRW